LKCIEKLKIRDILSLARQTLTPTLTIDLSLKGKGKMGTNRQHDLHFLGKEDLT
jgi:hypothetical protein